MSKRNSSIVNYINTIDEASRILSDKFICSADALPPLHIAKQRFEQWLVLMALKKTENDIIKAAELLETTPRVLYKLVNTLAVR